VAVRHLSGKEPVAQGLRVAPRQRFDLAQALQTVDIADARGFEPRREGGRVPLMMFGQGIELTRLILRNQLRFQPLR
jgi:hypothetical protein